MEDSSQEAIEPQALINTTIEISNDILFNIEKSNLSKEQISELIEIYQQFNERLIAFKEGNCCHVDKPPNRPENPSKNISKGKKQKKATKSSGKKKTQFTSNNVLAKESDTDESDQDNHHQNNSFVPSKDKQDNLIRSKSQPGGTSKPGNAQKQFRAANSKNKSKTLSSSVIFLVDEDDDI
ncbi:hypothetical protein TRFO_11071 [Tritrichomonas foetus]|uniref:Uncharacterized protein n=1 Tax=Tritrichomonas foetus TaxID=1144522 RepID=A0A1J4JAJ0_9EUKA|nr:hypothetical protein TRFO_11071 [Tritrichomonas foetus]|eukprot:OHS94461.1 hypothetical protein TRFO_11071 [Tritrichomonas foetus]